MEAMEPGASPIPQSRIVEPAMRVNALFQIALGLSMNPGPDWSATNLRLSLGAVRDGEYQTALSFANGDYELAFAVARGELDVATVNPSAFASSPT